MSKMGNIIKKLKNHCSKRSHFSYDNKSSQIFFLLALKKLRNSIDIEDDIMEMRAEEQAQMAEAKITLFELVTSPTLKFPLLIAVIMQLSQQLSGINAVIQI